MAKGDYQITMSDADAVQVQMEILFEDLPPPSVQLREDVLQKLSLVSKDSAERIIEVYNQIVQRLSE